MNIDEYRAIKAQQATQTTEQTPTTPPITPTPTETPPNTPKPTNEPNAPPDKILIDGVGEITLDELKNGYLRTQDYTKKTQEVARQRDEVQDAMELYAKIKADPNYLTELANGNTPLPNQLDPLLGKLLNLEALVYDMQVEKDISALQSKYPDFEIKEVLNIAHEKQISLEDAYLLNKSIKTPVTADTEAIRKQIREEVLKEIEANNDVTRTIIGSGGSGTVIEDKTPELSNAEKKVASRMFRDAKDPFAEYVKWRNKS